MRIPLSLTLLPALGLALSAQTAPGPQGPVLKWRGALWASGAASNQETVDGSLFLRSMDSGDGHLALDGAQLGADVTLSDGWSLKATLLGGQTAKVLNATSQETGSLAFAEAMLVWTGGQETLRIGRMYTAMGMEVMDQTQDIAASRGLLFTYAIPFGQVGLDWHHAFTSSWSADLYLTNGEDRIKDNNRGKTAGLGLTYNHGGATDRFVTLMAFSGAEQDGLGDKAGTGAEGRKRDRISLAGQWTWGASTLAWEGEWAREAFPIAAIQGARNLEDAKATWSGLGLTFKHQFTPAWAGFLRAETLKDGQGVRLNGDPTTGAAWAGRKDADLRATSAALGVERKWHETFTRLEIRQDRLNRDVTGSGTGKDRNFRDALSVTWSVGTSF